MTRSICFVADVVTKVGYCKVFVSFVSDIFFSVCSFLSDTLTGFSVWLHPMIVIQKIIAKIFINCTSNKFCPTLKFMDFLCLNITVSPSLST